MRWTLFAIAACGTAAGALMSTRAGVVRPEPGQWTFEARIERLSTAGLPPDVNRAQLREALFGEMLRAAGPNCITAGQAARALDPDHLRIDGFSRAQCRTTISERSGETIRIAGACTDARGTRRDFTITGIFGARHIDLLIRYQDRAAARGARIDSELRFSGRRTGPCDENAAAARLARESGPTRTPGGGGAGVEASNMAATHAGAR